MLIYNLLRLKDKKQDYHLYNQSILDTYKTFTYEKSSLALQSAGEGTNDFMIKANLKLKLN